ncbi:Uncharacterised hydrolase TatD-type [Acididesulfobacillus acetoxydans]|uniref:Tat-linked quality control protein TatD n=1 Tax=Acididesulfobacillus acetoxydans TaxID=1561005 RepID=A0A8S0WE54_9FIRM|nr:TatD family hydrolase [Acididesulfobacillus acetoxydans]CAA7599872.1 Uncharacterised hydrolase TatD-type [Acididesulfobacillus acetoxydans]CEJ07438.1 Tat-linked quality control protein TatD [Acididesulfobacillus acetoxydans]
MIWDTHAHLDDARFRGDFRETVARAQAAGVYRILNPGYDLPSSRAAAELASKTPFIWAAVGIHPHDAEGADQEVWDELIKLAKQPKVVAWGEIGLDYYRDLSPRRVQKEVFIRQIELANGLGLPIIVHNRDAHQDVLTVVKEYPPEKAGVFHVYSGSWEMAKELLALGFYLSFGGPLTYKNARQVLEVAKNVPSDRFMVETDSPYLTPEPYRGKRNEPAYVRRVVERLAEVRGESPEKIASQAAKNAGRLFGIPDTEG